MSKLRVDATTVTKAFTALLFLVALVSVVGLVSERSVGGLLEGLSLLYLVVVLIIGVFRDITQTSRWRAAFFGGIVVWSMTNYFFAGGDQVSLLLGVAGSVMLVQLGYQHLQADQ
ncbi:hypothetical protein ACFFQF_12090 [Haladaptatus pallidirubidus]|uniref:SPW repeat-containing protein n=1 Tax=Haladaptatus pallidirubidus TaxID=1008152 RepID=A0AAV3UEK1_9EURY|nr:hypothetical protein [Haladaptatus pallidirubidus]